MRYCEQCNAATAEEYCYLCREERIRLALDAFDGLPGTGPSWAHEYEADLLDAGEDFRP